MTISNTGRRPKKKAGRRPSMATPMARISVTASIAQIFYMALSNPVRPEVSGGLQAIIAAQVRSDPVAAEQMQRAKWIEKQIERDLNEIMSGMSEPEIEKLLQNKAAVKGVLGNNGKATQQAVKAWGYPRLDEYIRLYETSVGRGLPIPSVSERNLLPD